ncbi:MAG: DUF4430 domain-containing protein [Traorella sp.]
MDKKKKVLVTILAVVLLVFGGWFFSRSYVTHGDGEITVELKDIDGNLLSEKNIAFYKGDKLVDLLSNNYDNVVIENGMIMSIDTLTTASDWSQFIMIYVDDEASNVGILEIQYEDGTKITFELTAFIYE